MKMNHTYQTTDPAQQAAIEASTLISPFDLNCHRRTWQWEDFRRISGMSDDELEEALVNSLGPKPWASVQRTTPFGSYSSAGISEMHWVVTMKMLELISNPPDVLRFKLQVMRARNKQETS